MCGGIGFNFKRISLQELAEFYTPLEIAKFQKTGRAESFFHQRIPVLPVEENGQIHLFHWGNRDKNLPIPQTGWAKEESIDEGKWRHYKPRFVKIEAEQGCEKGTWFDVPGGGLKGVAIASSEGERVYMVTKKADADYLELTKHDRQPVWE